MAMLPPGSSSRRGPLLLLSLYAGCCFLLLSSLWLHVAAQAASSTSFSFDFSNKSSYSSQDLRLEGSADPKDNLVDLTYNLKGRSMSNCTGRMSYNNPVPFYDNITGQVASFITQFTFAIKLMWNGTGKVTARGDGMAFFLASYPSQLPPNSAGGNLGLINAEETTASGAGWFIAIEFDTWENPWDPRGASDHIGIDINSMTSDSTTRLPSLSLNGSMTASITFNGSTRMMVASLHFDDHPSLAPAEVSTKLLDPLTNLLPPEVAVGFSAATGNFFELHQIVSWSFNSTLTRKETSEANVQQKQDTVLGDKGHMVVIIGVAVLSLPVGWFILSCCMWRHARVSFAKRAGLRRFLQLDFRDLVKATSKFSKENKIGEGNFGVVYKGTIKNNGQEEHVAVKKLKEYSTGETKAPFLDELQACSRISHKNLVRLKGWCCSRNEWKLVDFMCWCRQQNFELYLVHELVPNGSLHDYLHKREEALPWDVRYKIVKGIASGLHYLHHQCDPFILHRDIKPGNILLDKDFSAKLADFGLSRIADDNNTSLVTTARGTIGYIDPQCKKHGKVNFNRSTDVYSFGVVLLEIACNKTWEEVQGEYRKGSAETLEAVADEKLRGVFNRKEMDRVVFLGLRCCQTDGSKRPTMDNAMHFLEHGIELPEKNLIRLSRAATWPREQGTELPKKNLI